jgi:hypothetical protein
MVEVKFSLHAIEAYRGNEGMAPLILNPGSGWMSVVSHMFQLLYTTGTVMLLLQ